MKEKTHETSLPEGYVEALKINAKDIKFGIIFNLIAGGVMVIVILLSAVLLLIGGKTEFEIIGVTPFVIFFACYFAYIILHELLHGIVYKLTTGEKLRFGLSWSCAFCGVPDVYVYRSVSIIACAAPFVVLSLLLIPLYALLYFVDPLFFLLCAVLLGSHLGGCCGDLYVIGLLLFRYKDKRALIRDTGPVQTFFIPSDKNSKNGADA